MAVRTIGDVLERCATSCGGGWGGVRHLDDRMTDWKGRPLSDSSKQPLITAQLNDIDHHFDCIPRQLTAETSRERKNQIDFCCFCSTQS